MQFFLFHFEVNQANQKIGKKLGFTSALSEIHLAKLFIYYYFEINQANQTMKKKKTKIFTSSLSEITSATIFIYLSLDILNCLALMRSVLVIALLCLKLLCIVSSHHCGLHFTFEYEAL